MVRPGGAGARCARDGWSPEPWWRRRIGHAEPNPPSWLGGTEVERRAPSQDRPGGRGLPRGLDPVRGDRGAGQWRHGPPRGRLGADGRHERAAGPRPEVGRGRRHRRPREGRRARAPCPHHNRRRLDGRGPRGCGGRHRLGSIDLPPVPRRPWRGHGCRDDARHPAGRGRPRGAGVLPGDPDHPLRIARSLLGLRGDVPGDAPDLGRRARAGSRPPTSSGPPSGRSSSGSPTRTTSTASSRARSASST